MADVDMTTVTDTTIEASPINPLDEVFNKIDEMAVLAAYLKKVVKPLLKKGAKTKRRTPDGERTRNGFQSPVIMAPVLVDFLNNVFPDRGIVLDTPLPRTDVTQLITTYIKSSNLQLAENRKNFTVDAKLSKVFNVEEGYISNWFEMQKFMRAVLTSVKQDSNNNSGSTNTVEAGPSTTTANTETKVGKTPAAAPAAAPSAKRIKKGGGSNNN